MTCNLENESYSSENLDYRTKIPMYIWRQGNTEELIKYENYLNPIDQMVATHDMNLDEKVNFFYDSVESAVKEIFIMKKNGEESYLWCSPGH